MRLLIVNIFFEPHSFGGATIVAENLAAHMAQHSDISVAAVSADIGPYPTGVTTRYSSKLGFDAFCVGLPNSDHSHKDVRIKNKIFDKAIAEIVDFVEPDVVHVHCCQDIGSSFFDVLVERSLPFAVTVHDFWHLCARQFMIDQNGESCNQTKIDFKKCDVCIGSTGLAQYRSDYLNGQLDKANLILTPSDYTRDMIISNGIDPKKVRVNKNGVKPPFPDELANSASKIQKPIRVGFVGGPGTTKGWDLVLDAVRKLPPNSIVIKAVDAGANIGLPWLQDYLKGADGLPVEVIPGYSQANIDSTFSEFDAIICPSRCKETFGLTAREGHIRGLWVIASAAGGLAEDILDGENGRVLSFPPTVTQVHDALLEIIERGRGPDASKRNIQTVAGQAEELAAWLREL